MRFLSAARLRGLRFRPRLHRLTIPLLTSAISLQSWATEEAPPRNTQRSIPFRLLGDADGNGTVNEDDVRFLQMYCASFVGRDYIEFENADVNADGKLSVKDSTLIQRYIKYGKF